MKKLVPITTIILILIFNGCLNRNNKDTLDAEFLSTEEYQSLKTLDSLDSLLTKEKDPNKDDIKMTRREFKKYWATLLTDLKNRKKETNSIVSLIKSEINDTTKIYKNLKVSYMEAYEANEKYIDLVSNYMRLGFKERKNIKEFEDKLKISEVQYSKFIKVYDQSTESSDEISFVTLTSTLISETDSTSVEELVPSADIVAIITEVVIKVVDYIVDKANEINEKKLAKLITQLDTMKWESWDDIK